MAGRGAEGAGDRRAHLRDHHGQERRLRPLRGHALAGLQGRRDRDRRDQRGRRRHARAGRDLPAASRSSPTSSPPPAAGPRTSRTRRWAASREPWLKSVDDEYDSVSPRHRWTPKLTMAQASTQARRARARVFKGIRVTKRGASPRIMTAEVVGSRGDRRPTAPRCAPGSACTTRGRTSRRSAARRRADADRPVRRPGGATIPPRRSPSSAPRGRGRAARDRDRRRRARRGPVRGATGAGSTSAASRRAAAALPLPRDARRHLPRASSTARPGPPSGL